MTTAKDVMPAYIAARRSNPAHFLSITERFAIREAQTGRTVSASISGSVADTCRGRHRYV
jgi:hypothetical protein